ncbi:MAG: glycosyltransferase family 39 protein [Cyanobacteria bacterium J06634_6]
MEKPSERLLSSKAFSPDAKWILLLTVAAIALWLIGLGNMPLRDWDEGYYSVVARELTQTHHWLYPTRFGAPYFPKPPFGYWLGSMGYWLFGEVNEFTTRFPMAIATALGVPLLYSVVRELSPRRREAILTAGVYMTMLSVVRLGRLHMFDGYINTLLILWMLCLLKAKTSRPWAVGMGFCLAGIALSKGILAIALGGVLLIFVIADRRWSLLQNPYTWLGLAIGIGLTVGWNVLQILQYGNLFIQEHLGLNNLDRISKTLEGHDGPPWYYLLVMIKGTVPWVLFWPGGLWLAWRSPGSSLGRLILSGNILFLVMASAMGTKLPWYIMPIYPFMAMAIGWQVSRPVKEYAYSLRWILGVLSVGGLGGAVYFAIADPKILLISLCLCFAITLFWVTRRLVQSRSDYASILVIGLYSCLMLLMGSRAWVWEVNESFPVKDVGRMVLIHVPAGERFYSSYDYGRPSLEFYAERKMAVGPDQELRERREEGRYLLLEADALKALEIPPEAIIESTEGFSLVAP